MAWFALHEAVNMVPSSVNGAASARKDEMTNQQNLAQHDETEFIPQNTDTIQNLQFNSSFPTCLILLINAENT